MKAKVLFLSLLLGLGVLKANDIEINGQITAIDDANKTITLNGTQVIKVFPHTKLKGDNCGLFGSDLRGKFVDLKVNMFVEVEMLPQFDGSLGAKEIEWKCGGNAY